MKTKKDNEIKATEINKDTIDQAERWAHLPIEVSAVQVDPGDYAVPNAALDEGVQLANSLLAFAPVNKDPRLLQARVKLEEARDVGRAYLHYRNAEGKQEVQKPRVDVVSLASLALRLLDGLGGSRSEALAVAARRVRRSVFGEGHELPTAGPWGLWSRVNESRLLLEADGALDAELRTMVPSALLDDLFAANDRLGAAVGIGGEVVNALPYGKDAVRALLWWRTTRHVLHTLTAAEESLSSVQQVKAVLRPVVMLRDELAQRRVRKKGRAEEVDEVEEDADPPAVGTPVTATPGAAAPEPAVPGAGPPAAPGGPDD